MNSEKKSSSIRINQKRRKTLSIHSHEIYDVFLISDITDKGSIFLSDLYEDNLVYQMNEKSRIIS